MDIQKSIIESDDKFIFSESSVTSSLEISRKRTRNHYHVFPDFQDSSLTGNVEFGSDENIGRTALIEPYTTSSSHTSRMHTEITPVLDDNSPSSTPRKENRKSALKREDRLALTAPHAPASSGIARKRTRKHTQTTPRFDDLSSTVKSPKRRREHRSTNIKVSPLSESGLPSSENLFQNKKRTHDRVTSSTKSSKKGKLR